MPESGYLVDSSLLVLLVAGRTDPRIIGRHRRLKDFSRQDFDLLRQMIHDAGGTTFCTPNTLTEASNHLRQCSEPWRRELSRTLATLINDSREIVVTSSQVVLNQSYDRLGLADAASLEACNRDRPILTVDLLLFNEAEQSDHGRAVYFEAFRDPAAL